MKPQRGILLLMLFFALVPAFSQESLLERRVSISAVNLSVEEILNQLSMQTNTRFSYNSDIIPDKKITLYASSQSMGKVLQQVFGKDFIFRSTQNHIIILKKTSRGEKVQDKTDFIVSGRIINSRTQQPVANVTVFDMAYMQSALSDSSGNYAFRFKQKTDRIALRFTKAGFTDTLLILNSCQEKIPLIYLSPETEKIPRMNIRIATGIELSDTGSIGIVKSLVVQEMLINSFNAFIPDKRIAQISLLPQWGTNRRMSGSVVNYFSVNLLAGYSYGVSGCEIGGGANIVQKNVNGLQGSMVLNVAGGNVNGLQVTGGLNHLRGNLSGVQASLFLNTGVDTMKGVQVSGLLNVAREVHGAQFSLISNNARGNHTDVQMSGFLNYAPHPKFQLGLINIADTNNGVPVGVINIVRNGYYSVNISTDEMLFTKFLFGMGTYKMHSYLGAGIQLHNTKNNWELCYGLGSHFRYNHTIGLNADILASVISTGTGFDENTISEISLSLKPSVRIFKQLYISAGPSVSVFISGANNVYVDTVIEGFHNHYFFQAVSETTQYHMFLGGEAEIRFVF